MEQDKMTKRLAEIGFSASPDGDAWVMNVDLNVAERHLDPADEVDAMILKRLREHRDASRGRGFEPVSVPMPNGGVRDDKAMRELAMEENRPEPTEAEKRWAELNAEKSSVETGSLAYHMLDVEMDHLRGQYAHYVDIAKACYAADAVVGGVEGTWSTWEDLPEQQKLGYINGVLYRLRNPDDPVEPGKPGKLFNAIVKALKA